MSAQRVVAVLLLAAPLAACTTASTNCVLLPLPTATPIQYAPTPIGGFPIVPGVCPEAPTATARPSAPTSTAGPGLGQVSNVADTLAFLPEDEQLQAVFASSGRYAVVYRLGTELVVVHTYGELRLPGVARAGIAYRADQVALVQSTASGTTVSFGAALGDADSATIISGPNLGSDLALIYGGEGWLYLASGGFISRFNPAAGAFEASGIYSGQAISMGKTAHGAVLLATTAGVWRKPFDQAWGQVFGGPITGLAVLGEQVAATWTVEGGAGAGTCERHWTEGRPGPATSAPPSRNSAATSPMGTRTMAAPFLCCTPTPRSRSSAPSASHPVGATRSWACPMRAMSSTPHASPAPGRLPPIPPSSGAPARAGTPWSAPLSPNSSSPACAMRNRFAISCARNPDQRPCAHGKPIK